MTKKSMSTILYVIMTISIIFSCVMLYKGYDKMTNYERHESILLDDVNAYVGGDAYNYIINGTYATSFFVLAGSGFIVSIISFVGACYFSVNVDEKKEDVNELPPI